MERTTSPTSNYAPSKATGHITEMDPISYDEPVPEDEEAFSDSGNQPIEVDLTIHVPPEVIVDDHALALVQVVPPTRTFWMFQKPGTSMILIFLEILPKMERNLMGHMMANTTMKKIPHWILMPLVMTRRRSTMSLVKALTTLMALPRAMMSLVKALIVLIVPMRTMMSLMEALSILILMRILYHIQMVNNLCGYLGLLTRDSEIYSGIADPANAGAIIPLFCQGAVNPANTGVEAPIYQYWI